jgi:hypothetical protein
MGRVLAAMPAIFAGFQPISVRFLVLGIAVIAVLAYRAL